MSSFPDSLPHVSLVPRLKMLPVSARIHLLNKWKKALIKIMSCHMQLVPARMLKMYSCMHMSRASFMPKGKTNVLMIDDHICAMHMCAYIYYLAM